MLIDKITYETKFEPVMRLIFGNIAIVTEISKSNYEELVNDNGLSFVTLNGSFLSANGGLYVPNVAKEWTSIIELSKRQTEYLSQMVTIEASAKHLYAEIEAAINKLATIDNQNALICTKLKAEYNANALFVNQIKKELRLFAPSCRAEVEESAISCKAHLQGLLIRQEGLTGELQEDLLSELSAEDTSIIAQLIEEIPRLQMERSSIADEFVAINIDHLAERLNYLSTTQDENNLELDLKTLTVREAGNIEREGQKLQDYLMECKESIREAEITNNNNMDEALKMQSDLLNHTAEWQAWMHKKLAFEEQWENHARNLETLAIQCEDLLKDQGVHEQDIAELNPTANEAAMEKYEDLGYNEVSVNNQCNKGGVECLVKEENIR